MGTDVGDSTHSQTADVSVPSQPTSTPGGPVDYLNKEQQQ